MAGGILPSVNAEYSELTGPMAAASVQASPRPRQQQQAAERNHEGGNGEPRDDEALDEANRGTHGHRRQNARRHPQPATWHEAATRPDRNATLPMDRSISPMMMRMATPAAATATAAVWRISSAAFVGVTKMPSEAT